MPKASLHELKALFRLALPLALASVGHATMGVVDTVILGRHSAAAQAGAGLGNALYFLVTVLGMGVVMGLDPLMSQAVGANDKRRARGLLHQGLYLSAAVTAALALIVLGLWWALPALGAEPKVAQIAADYVAWRALGLWPMLAFMAVRSYLQATGRPGSLVAATVLANLLNVVLDILFVFGGAGLPAWTGLRWLPPMGASGAALTTSVCTFAQLAVVAWAARDPARDAAQGSRPERGPNPDELRKAVRVGLPIGLHMLAEVGAFSLAALLAARAGTSSAAAHAAAISVASLTFCVAVGIANAGAVRVGWAVGAGEVAKARTAGLVAFGAGSAFMGVCALVLLVFPGELAALLTEPSVRPVAAALFFVTAVFQLSDGAQAIGAGVLRGAGETRFTFVANVIGHYAIGLPIAAFLGFWAQMGVVGIWWGLCAGLWAVSVALFVRFVQVTSRAVRPL